jgi:hypothetical protein
MIAKLQREAKRGIIKNIEANFVKKSTLLP